MILLAIAAALPGVFWDAPPDTAAALREAGIRRIVVPAEQVAAWKQVEGIAVAAGDPRQAVKVRTPAVNYRFDQASASRVPWIDSNGWRFLRQPDGRFFYDSGGAAAALAAAEAFAWGANAMVKTDAAGLKPLGDMLAFAAGIESAAMQPVVDFGFVDDGSATAGEVMNLLVRHTLLFRVVKAPDPKLKLTVQLGSRKYPLEAAKNPGAMAQMVRADLTDERRSLRIYGSAVVVGRVESAPGRVRVHLVNYDGGRKVNGLRVRVAGRYANYRLAAAGNPDLALMDYDAQPDATEFTLPELKTYAVIDLLK
ncbi:MAG TPA: hypothetical protein VMH28_23410 [Candidatus Acidoferrales bacterium]|nr:hypothetical protein [Candidatus Acidoferrales bacterium]